MNNIENLLSEEKKKIDKIEIPNDMEDRLRTALNDTSIKKKKGFQMRAATILIIVLLLSYNMDTLAFYGKKLVGYDDVMNGTLERLNEMGKGQLINKSYTFSDGVEVVLDGVMLDDNNMVVFYTINDPNGDARNKDINVYIKGFFGRNLTHSGSGIISEDGTKMNWIINTHGIPMFFERSMTFEVNYRHDDNSMEYGEISFKLDRNQAVGKSLKININKKLELGNRSIKVKTMVASPTTTIVKGEIQNLLELGLDYIRDMRIRPYDIEMELIANGKRVEKQGGGMSTDNKGSTFHVNFDALPPDTKDIELRLVSFSGDYDVKEIYKLEKGNSINFKVMEQDISINDVYEANGNTYISFTTEDSVLLSRVYLNIDGARHELQETIYGSDEKIIEGDKAKILFTRTMRFKGTGENLQLDIQRIRYDKIYDELIYKE